MLQSKIMFKSPPFLIIIWCLISSSTSQSRQLNSVQFPIDPSNVLKTAKLNDLVFNIVRDERSNEIFIGGRNYLYKLSSDDLKVIQNTSTGPDEHHPDCKPKPESCHRSRYKIDNDNKLLILYMGNKHYSKLLSCGTTHQGMCLLHQKHQIDSKRFFGSPSVVDNFIVSSTNVVGFLANVSYENDSVIMLGNQYDGRNMTLSPPLISSKKLMVKNGVGFEHAHNDSNHWTSIDIDPLRKQGYPVTFITGFSHESYAYFVTTSPVSYGSSDHETRISRVCLNDKSFKSFIEMPLSCEDMDMVYNIATSAYIGSSWSSQDKDVLYVSFMHAPSKRGPMVDQDFGSVICSFSMSTISKMFYETAKNCSDGSDDVSRSTIFLRSPISERCVIDRNFNDESLCHPRTNYFIEGGEHVTASPLFKLPSLKITSLTTTTSQSGNAAAAVIAIVGTSTGRIYKILLDSKAATTLNNSNRILYNTTVQESVPQPKKSDDSEVRPSTTFDSNGDNLFLLSGRSVIKFPVKSCSIYTTCGKCLSTLDPLGCGWCNGKCGHAKECPISSPPDRSTCTPVIYDFKPKKGATHGGAKVTIYGDNFSSLSIGQEIVNANILFGTSPCDVKSWNMTVIICVVKKSTAGPTEVKLRIEVNDLTMILAPYKIKGEVTSRENFEYVDPVITGIWPKFGPQSGGTNLTIMGQNLDSGVVRKILIGSSLCRENTNNGKNLTCITGDIKRKSDIGVQRIQLHIDGWGTYLPYNFTYKSDPSIHNVHPLFIVASGGVEILVEGDNLDSLSRPKMAIQVHDNNPLVTDCKVLNSTLMSCIAPPVWDKLKPDREPVSTDLYFSMDGIIIGRKFELKYYPDPTVYPFDDVQPVHLQDPVIEVIGTNLRPEFEMKIHAGVDKTPCKILDSSVVGSIKCQLQLNAEPNIGDALEVFYTLGKKSERLGSISFINKPGPSSKTFVIVTVVFLLLLSLVALVFFCLKKQGLIMKKKKHPSFSVEYRPEGPLENDYGQNGRNGGESGIPLIAGARGFYIDDETMAILTGERKLIAREYLTIGDVVGKGHFGCVCAGTLFDPDTEQTLQVAIKTLQANSITSNRDVEMFVKEALIMKDFSHERVLNLIGVTFSQDDNLPLVVIPFMKNGDLLSYIRDESNDPTVKDLITFAVEIAEGMEYLSAQKCVHRDLAARNCMLDANRHVKVADFGLSRDVYEQEYYKSATQSELPVKWMAPESLEKGSYSSKSDVWSYGVTVWELMTRGIPPYPQINSWEIGSYIKAGHRLPQTDCCPNQLYDIMLSCWLYDPKMRPTFSQLVRDVQNVITTLENYSRSRVVTREINYINYPPTSIYANEFESEVLNAVAPIIEGAVGGQDIEEEEEDPSKIIGKVMKQNKLSGESSWC